MKQILLLDNYDSFTYNLVHLVEQFDDVRIVVKRNNEININICDEFDAIMLSPGPGLPKDAGVMMELIDVYHTTKPIFGVCLGMQAIGEYFGAKLVNMPEVQHGVKTEIYADTNSYLFKNIPKIIGVGRYHSWVFEKAYLPYELKEIASDNNYVMALEHSTLSICGVQFHPESIMTNYGKQIIENWLNTI